MANKFHKVHFFLTQANTMCDIIRTTAPCSSSAYSFTALVLQETTLCVNQYKADNRHARSCNISFCSSTEHYIQCSKSKLQHTHHHGSPFSSSPWLMESKWWVSCVVQATPTLRRGISRACWMRRCNSLICWRTSGGTGLQQAMMPWGSLKRDEKNSVCCIYGRYVRHLHSKDMQRDITMVLTVTE